MTKMIEMKVSGIALNAITKSPIVLLEDLSDSRKVPIFIGKEQAKSVISGLEKQKPDRPLMHDLFTNFLQEWKMNLERIVINSLHDNTFYAVLCVSLGEEKKEIDCRPSDAIAIALRTNSPIFITEQVIAEASIPAERNEEEE